MRGISGAFASGMHVSSTAPSNPRPGQMCYDVTKQQMLFWTGTQWIPIADMPGETLESFAAQHGEDETLRLAKRMLEIEALARDNEVIERIYKELLMAVKLVRE